MRAAPIGLRDGDREQLERWVRSSTIPGGLAQRARIVLLVADGVSNVEIAERLGVSKPTVTSWRDRYRDGGLAALDDRPRSGRPRTLGHREIVAATLKSPPAKLEIAHWSSRLLARHLKIGDATVARAWREYGIQPWRAETFKFSSEAAQHAYWRATVPPIECPTRTRGLIGGAGKCLTKRDRRWRYAG